MARLLAALLSALFASVCCHAAPRRADSRIVNGTDVMEGQYPFMISLRYDGNHSCGGSVLSEEWVLTAAHCVYRVDPKRLSVFAGSNRLDDDTVSLIPVSEAIVHEGYNKSLSVNDIAVVKLSEPLSLGQRVRPTALPLAYQMTSVGSPATVIGWGLPYTGGEVMNILQAVDINVWSNRKCREAYLDAPKPILPSNICAGVPEGGRGQCSGDSGGPLIANGYQIGIVSWSRKPCTVKGSPGVFTRVSYYVNWILQKTGTVWIPFLPF